MAVTMSGWARADQARGLSAEAWLRMVYDQSWAPMVRLASLLLGSTDRAEEIVQDAIVAVFRRRSMFGDEVPRAYLRTAVVNACRSAHRHLAVVDRNRTEAPVEHVGPYERVAQDETSREVMAALRTLPQRQQEVLVLRYYSDLSEAEIAEALGISRGSVKSHASRAVAALRQALAGLHGPSNQGGERR